MIIFVSLMLSQQLLNSDSNYIVFKNALPEFIKQRPDLYFVLPFPSSSAFRYYADGLSSNEHVVRVPKRMPSGKRNAAIDFDSEFYAQVFARYPPDLIWCHNVEIGHLLAAFNDALHTSGQPPVVNHHHFPPHESLPGYRANRWAHIILAQLASSVLVDMNVFESQYAKTLLLDNAHAYAWPYAERRVAKSEVLTLGCIDEARYDALREPQRYSKTTIVYNHRLQLYKRWLDTFKVLAELAKSGYHFDVVITSGGGDNVQRALRDFTFDEPFVRVVETPLHDDYLRELSRCHINTTNSAHETFCISIAESMYYGHAVVAPRSVTFPELLGDDYPYLFDTPAEQRGQLAYLIENEQTREKIGRQNAERARKLFGSKIFVTRYLRLFDEAIESRESSVESIKPQTRAVLLRYLRQKSYLTLNDWHDITQRTKLGAQAFPPERFAKTLRELGYESKIVGGKIAWLKQSC